MTHGHTHAHKHHMHSISTLADMAVAAEAHPRLAMADMAVAAVALVDLGEREKQIWGVE